MSHPANTHFEETAREALDERAWWEQQNQDEDWINAQLSNWKEFWESTGEKTDQEVNSGD